MIARKIYGGTGETTFTPDGTMTRCMLAQILYNLESNPKTTAPAHFKDGHANTWCREAISRAFQNDVVSGYPDGSFAVNHNITRKEPACMLNRYAGSPKAKGRTLNFRDRDQVSDYSYNSVLWAVEEGILAGTDSDTLSPQGVATRAQVAAMLMRFINL